MHTGNISNTPTSGLFSDLTASLNEIDTALQKGIYATTPTMMASLYSEIYRQSSLGGTALGELPYSYAELQNTAKFLAQVGDYSYALSKNAVAQGEFTEEDRQNLVSLSATAQQLAAQLTDLQAELNEKTITIDDIRQAQQQLAEQDTGSMGYSLQQIESEFPETPSLIYDGPFSSHLENESPVYLEGREEVDMETARKNAADMLGLKPELLSYSSTSEGKLKTFDFSGQVDGGELWVEVTCVGGVVFNVLSSRMAGNAVYDAQECVQKAHEFLSANGYEDMKESYWIINNNIITINFAYSQGDVLCYPDLIKVSIAQDTGKMVGFEAKGYIMRHTERDVSNVQIGREQAEAAVSGLLQVESYQLCVIPSSGERDVLCHEFLCINEEGKTYLVYINAATGNEEKILILIEEENGTLTI